MGKYVCVFYTRILFDKPHSRFRTLRILTTSDYYTIISGDELLKEGGPHPFCCTLHLTSENNTGVRSHQ